jgi:hypothetical protein
MEENEIKGDWNANNPNFGQPKARSSIHKWEI